MVMRRRRGVALIFVLWILVVLGLAVGELVSRERLESEMVATLRSRAVARYAAESGITATTAALQTVLDSAPTPVELAARLGRLDTIGKVAARLVTGESECAVVVLDLNARLDLNHSDSTALQALFAEFIPSGRAAQIVGALRQSPITRFSELARLSGADDSIAMTVAPYVTVSSNGFVNVNSASEAVLAAMPGIGPSKARAMVARRGDSEPLTSADPFRPTPSPGTRVSLGGTPLTISPTRLMIVSRGWQRGSPYTQEIQAVYSVLARRLTLISWEERNR